MFGSARLVCSLRLIQLPRLRIPVTSVNMWKTLPHSVLVFTMPGTKGTYKSCKCYNTCTKALASALEVEDAWRADKSERSRSECEVPFERKA